MNKVTNVLLAAIFVLLILNLRFTLVVLDRLPTEKTGGEEVEELLDPDIVRFWGDKVARLYNDQDHQALYALFSKQARVKISPEQLESQLEKLLMLFGDIEEHAFVKTSKLGEKGQAQYYQLLYNVRVSENPSPATMTLSLVVENDAVSLYGLRTNGSAQLD
jgi:hypothetical protein